MTTASHPAPAQRRPFGRILSGAPPLALAAALVAALGVATLSLGPVAVPADRVLAALIGAGDQAESAIVWEIRLPRLLLGLAVGAALALSGATLQGLLRNPLADPGLIGVTAGASVSAVAVIVLGDWVMSGLPAMLRPWLLPIAAFLGGGAVMAFVFAFARRQGGTSVTLLILAGIAVNAIAVAGIGALTFVSSDQQLRDLSLWTMGSLGGATWPMTLAAAALTAATAPLFLAHARALDLFQLGERAAFHSGLDVERVKLLAGVVTALAVGAVTAAAGPIGFIGLIAPHLARLLVGPAHAILLPTAALMGCALTLGADLVVRLAAPPAEPPIGIATALIGGPFFLWLLLRGRGGHA